MSKRKDRETTIVVTEITDENRDVLFKIALSMYLGEQCKYCDRVYETLDDLKDTVFASYHERGRLACKTCWLANNPGTTVED